LNTTKVTRLLNGTDGIVLDKQVNHPFKMIYNARAVKYDLIQQFEASTGIILPSGVKSNLCTQTVPILGKQLAGMKVQIKETKK